MMKKRLLFSILCSLLMAMQPLMAEEDASLLFKYAKEGNVAGIRKLINAAVDVNQQEDRDGNTPLTVAARYGRPAVVQLLLNVPGINVNTENYVAMTALLEAASAKYTRIVQLLLNAPGIEIDKPGFMGITSLMFAARGNIAMLRNLLNAGADWKIASLEGQTALDIAIYNKFKDGIKALVKAGADYEPYIEVPVVQQAIRELFGTPQRLLEREIGGRIQPRRFGAPQLLESGSALGKRKRG